MASEPEEVAARLAAAAAEAQHAGDPRQFQNEILRVRILGTLKGEKITVTKEDGSTEEQKRAIIQETGFPVPVGAPRDQVALMVWAILVRTGGMSLKIDETHHRLYPLSELETVDLEFGTVAGITA